MRRFLSIEPAPTQRAYPGAPLLGREPAKFRRHRGQSPPLSGTVGRTGAAVF